MDRLTGRVTFIKRERGYGFLRDDNRKMDWFFPAVELPENTFNDLQVGDALSFLGVLDNRERNKAIEIKIEKGINNEN
jgi:cold shock CspA family protein